MMLHVALLDGFRDDTVTIRVNGNEVYRKPGVTTDLAISFADAVSVPVEGATARVEVAVEGSRAGSEEIRVTDTPFVGVRILGKSVEFRNAKEPIPML